MALNTGLIVLFMTKSVQMQIASERPLCRGWELCFNYPDNLLSGSSRNGGNEVTMCSAVTTYLTVRYHLRGKDASPQRGVLTSAGFFSLNVLILKIT